MGESCPRRSDGNRKEVIYVYGGLLPATGGFLNPLRILYILIAAGVFGGGLVKRKMHKQHSK